MIAIIDYGMGNLRSVQKAFEHLGKEAVITDRPDTIAAASHVVLPGVGAFEDAMARLRATGLDQALLQAARAGKPVLGICLGMQILFEHSEEDGGVDTLGIIRGRVRRFPDVPGCKVPEIGWNSVEGTGAAGEFYFVHSYYAEVVPETNLVSEYAGVKFTAMVAKGSLWACQFHPEKSGRLGLDLLARWLGLK